MRIGQHRDELSYDAYSNYMGVGISDAAIRKSIARTRENGRGGKNDYLQADVVGYEPTRAYDVILFRDSLYYVPRASVRSMLGRYSQYLTARGVFIVRMAGGS